MFSRRVLIIVAVMLTIAVVFLWVKLHAQEVRCVVACNRGIASPYEQLLTHMRQLAESGRTDELRALIIRAQERSSELQEACFDHKEDGAYFRQIGELLRPTAEP